ncbi:hypothetical protein B0T17DRAFT_656609 [Bombardia bombarda]|uniref:Uncharacterized protein n=1 Tax=Bombardia bombarda TaxID=252184 RepID=A0AA39WN81_9PEZI|nr:hypothetical protein B0T17DRAFT_656609 [Bombardia bombarda]
MTTKTRTLTPGGSLRGSTSRGSTFSSSTAAARSGLVFLSPHPADVEIYEKRPLPALPKRYSIASVLSKEMNKAFETPDSPHSFNSRSSEPNGIDWVRQESDFAFIFDEQAEGGRGGGGGEGGRASRLPGGMTPLARPHLSRVDVRDLPPPEARAGETPAPQLRISAKRILRLTTGAKASVIPVIHYPSPKSPGPSGHNSRLKIKQLMGADVAPDEIYAGSSDLLEIFSPLENRSSSIYSQDLDDADSESESVNDGHTRYSLDSATEDYTNNVENPKSDPDRPRPLTINRPERDDATRGRRKHGTPSMFPPGLEHTVSRTIYARDLYHETTAQLARVTWSAPDRSSPQSQSMPPPGTPNRWTTTITSPSNDGATTASSKTLFSSGSKLLDRSVSNVSSHPPTWHLGDPTARRRVTSTGTFGPWYRRSPSPLRNATTYYDDSVAVTDGSEAEGNRSPPLPHQQQQRRSLMSKVLRRISGSASNRPSSPPPPQQQQQQQYPFDIYVGGPAPSPIELHQGSGSPTSRRRRSQSSDRPPSVSGRSPPLSVTPPYLGGLSPGPGPGPPLPSPLSPLSPGGMGSRVSLALKTNELVGMMAMSKEERRRRSLKGKIRVLDDGGRVGSGEECIISSATKDGDKEETQTQVWF